ncbi:MAG: glutamate racemase [Caldicoprobacterales bacterium]|jgi:glutamate racemase|nr:glutamate racemase [Clostridiales bacterium]
MDNRPIGVFDSGLGGLTVVKELMKILPGENLVYFGDTARVPYGTRSNETVIRYSKQCIRFLLSQDVKMIVIACNTVSSISLDIVNKIFDIPILGVIEPGAKAAAQSTKNKRVGIIGTQATIRSKAYEKALAKHDPEISIFSTPCSLFVPIVEEGWSNTQIALLTAERYLDSMKGNEIDTLLLGCTHFPLLQDTIGKVMGPDVTLVNPAEGTALEVERILRSKNILNLEGNEGTYNFFVSDLGEKFEDIGGQFLGREIKCIQKIDIERY